MIPVEEFIAGLPANLAGANQASPWLIPALLQNTLPLMIRELGDEYAINNNIAIHHTAVVEPSAVIKGPAIIGPGTFIAAHAYLRGGVYTGSGVVIGPGCEVKTSMIMHNTHLAHFNFVGDSIIGSHVNIEAGAIICNHLNEKPGAKIKLLYNNRIVETGIEKFGALVGDNVKAGANAVLSPGTILPKGAIVKRLQLVEQVPV